MRHQTPNDCNAIYNCDYNNSYNNLMIPFIRCLSYSIRFDRQKVNKNKEPFETILPATRDGKKV